MDQTDNNAWALAALGDAISRYTDRAIQSPQTIQSGAYYGRDSGGNLYQVGQPSTGGGAAQVAQPINRTFLLLVAVAVYMAMKK